jgi:hypothetical protein
MNQLTINLILNTFVLFQAYRWLLRPKLAQLNPVHVLIPILLLHSMRHLALMFTSPAVVLAGMPPQFAIPAAAGDFLSAVLAMTAAILIQRKSAFAIRFTWLFTIVGSLDLVMAIVLARIFNAGDFMGAAYWIPTLWVPVMIVGHWIVFSVLRETKQTGATWATDSTHPATSRKVDFFSRHFNRSTDKFGHFRTSVGDQNLINKGTFR